MGDLLDRGLAFLDDQRHKHMSRTVVYQRGAEAKEVLATVGRTEFEQADDAGLIHRVESRDFLVRAADLDLGAGPILPRAGDQVRETVGAQVFVYEVNAPGGQPPFRYSDPYRRVLRVHTKHIGTES
ncbi:MAG: hypothetical protein WAZ94_01725 [Phycisphaerales bacterium]|jgi:hypothetical protein|nr:hypothetical protein [Phycisphaeraceae bacterium]